MSRVVATHHRGSDLRAIDADLTAYHGLVTLLHVLAELPTRFRYTAPRTCVLSDAPATAANDDTSEQMPPTTAEGVLAVLEAGAQTRAAVLAASWQERC